MIRTALNDVSRAYNTFKKAKEKMLSDLEKNTEKLAPQYKREETAKCTEAISAMRINYRRALQSILEDAEKAVGSAVPTALTSEQIRFLDGNKYFKYTPDEFRSMAQTSLKNKDLVFLRALKNTAAESGIKLDGLPMTDAEALTGLKQAVKYAEKLGEDNIQNPDVLEWGLNELIEQTADGLSLFDGSGDLKNITASYASEEPFLKGFNKGVGVGSGGGASA